MRDAKANKRTRETSTDETIVNRRAIGFLRLLDDVTDFNFDAIIWHPLLYGLMSYR
jgi:hypothetical protein